MKFRICDEVFKKLEGVCFGIVIARGIDNSTRNQAIGDMLDGAVKSAKEKFNGVKVKEHPQITPYREAFLKLGFNPNKFLSSIEALTSRIAKGGELPKINNIVDLVNAISLKYILPMGAHDIDKFQDDIEVRFSREGDIFVPFGSSEAENVEQGELIYVSGSRVKTRKWIWRQSEEGKITEESKNIFFPIDGFKGSNLDSIISARDELAKIVEGLFGCEIKVGFVDETNTYIEL